MSLYLFFGLPGVGKSTLMSKLIYQFTRQHKYNHIYCNEFVTIPGVIQISNDDIGKYNIYDGAVFIDEASLFADNRDFKNFTRTKLQYFVMHRHKNVDVYFFTQYYNGIDIKLRQLCTNVFYMYKPLLTGHWITKYYRINYGIMIPSKQDSQKMGEIVEGYSKPSIFQRIFCHRVFRPRYYKYFDSFKDWYLPPLPNGYDGYQPTDKIISSTQPYDDDIQDAEVKAI